MKVHSHVKISGPIEDERYIQMNKKTKKDMPKKTVYSVINVVPRAALQAAIDEEYCRRGH